MIEHELLFLGLLHEGPKHGYEIKRILESELIPFIGLKIKSIYYPLKQMEKLGLIQKDIGREGNYPEKFVYSITPKGEKIFQHLVTESFLSIERPYFSIDLALYFLPYVDKDIAKKRLRARIIFLKRIQRDLENLKKTVNPLKQHLLVILEHETDLVSAEIKSIGRLGILLK